MGDRVTALLEAVAAEPALDPAERLHLQLEAASERLADQRERIPLLDRRAADAGIDIIGSPEKLIPLLFAHTAYKSYPESFLLNGRWDRMSAWLSTVSAHEPTAVDLGGVADVDGWIARLAEAGIHLIVSSGTGGKNSFLPLDADDLSFLASGLFVNPGGRLPLTFLGPSNAPMRTAHTFRAMAARFGKEGAVRSLEEPLLVADMLRAAAIRKRMIEETALPSEVASFEAQGGAVAASRQAQLDTLIDHVLAQRDEPQVIMGGWGTSWRMLERARAQGAPDAPFHPDTFVSISGGRKGLDLPEDYEEQMARFLGPLRRAAGYGMSELTRPARLCADGVYHWPPSILLLMVDEAGEQLLEPGPDGSVTGRLAAYDPAWSGIWGGVISGDRVTARFGQCRCGAPGPTIDADIVRYSELSAAGDDKLTCGGTIDAYIRGVVGG